MGVSLWTRDKIAERILAGDALLVYRNDVLRIPDQWLLAHPGGELAIQHFVGRDATDEVDAFHSDAALKRLRAFTVGTLADTERPWNPFLPPIMSGWVRSRRTNKDGKQQQQQCWVREAASAHLDKANEHAPSSEVHLVPQHVPDTASGPTLATITQPPSELSLHEQAQHSAHYKLLHQRVVDAGLYDTPFLSGYGPEFARYTLLAVLAAVAYKHNWLMTSAVCLGLFWHQIMFFVHDLGHMGVTHDWMKDRAISIFLADFVGGLSVGWWVDVSSPVFYL